MSSLLRGMLPMGSVGIVMVRCYPGRARGLSTVLTPYDVAVGREREHRERVGRSLPPLALALLAAAPELFAQRARELPRGFVLVDVAHLVGVDFRHESGHSSRFVFGELLGSGGTLFDADGDGDMDLYLVSGNSAIGETHHRGRNALFLNDGGGRYRRAGAEAGVDFADVGMGVVSFDYDGDRDQDLYLTNRGPNRLLRNRGDATFEDVTARAGVGEPRWSAGSAVADYDRDGDLDIYVANYVVDDPYKPKTGLMRFLRGPQFLPALTNELYRNEGDGTFTARAVAAGVEGPGGKSLAAAFTDLDADGWPDLYVANDTTPNFVFENRGDGTFADRTLESGAAFGPTGLSEAGMGLAVADQDGDGLPDLFVTNYAFETNALYRNLGGFVFQHVSEATGLGAPSFPYVGFGTDFADLDDDGDLDLVVANGHTVDDPKSLDLGEIPGQELLLFIADGRGRFETAGVEAGAVFGRTYVGRGTIPGDIDDDGDLDLIVTSVDVPTLVLANSPSPGRPRSGHFLTVVLHGRGMNSDAVGAKVEVVAGGRTQTRTVMAGTSYLCDADPRLHFGLGELAGDVDVVRITWPSGKETLIPDARIDTFLEATEPE